MARRSVQFFGPTGFYQRFAHPIGCERTEAILC